MTSGESTKYVMIIENLLNKLKERHAACECNELRTEIDTALDAIDKLANKIDDDYWELKQAHLGPDF